MRIKSFLILIPLALTNNIHSQDSWSLEKCIDFAFENNNQIKQTKLQKQITEENLKANKFNTLPNLNAQTSYGYNFGQTIDPFTNEFAQSKVATNNFSLSSSITLFTGFRNINSIKQSNIQLEMNELEIDKSKNDLSLLIASAYLDYLFNNEIIKVAEIQLLMSKQQEERLTILINNGQLPKQNLLENQAQIAQDETSIITAKNNLILSKLNLAKLIQFPIEELEGFNIEIPSIDSTNIIYEELNTINIYNQSLVNLPDIKIQENKIIDAEYSVKISKSNLYPILSLSGGVGSGYSENNKEISGDPTFSSELTNLYVPSSLEVIEQVTANYQTSTKAYSDQISDNFNQQLFLTLSIPIFNGLSNKTAIQKSKINLESNTIQINEEKYALLTSIEQANLEYKAAYQKYLASTKTFEAQKLAFNYAIVQFENNMITQIDFQEKKNQLINADVEVLKSKYEFIFKKKILDFYQGKPITLN